MFPFRNFLNRFGECNLLRKINSLTSEVQFDVANFPDNFLSSVNLVSRNPFSIGVSSRSRCRRVNMQNKILYNFNIFSCSSSSLSPLPDYSFNKVSKRKKVGQSKIFCGFLVHKQFECKIGSLHASSQFLDFSPTSH